MEPRLDPPRRRLLELLAKKPADMKAASLAIGRNHAYLYQYIHRGSPRQLAEREREALAAYFDVDPDEFRSGPGRRTGKSEVARIYETIPVNRRREFLDHVQRLADLITSR